MADIAKVKRNIGKMIELGAPEEDIDAYIAGEGVTPEMLKEPQKKFDSLNTPTIEDTAGQVTEKPTPQSSPQMGAFEGLDNPVTQGVADTAYNTGKNIVESFGRTLSGGGLGNTIIGTKKAIENQRIIDDQAKNKDRSVSELLDAQRPENLQRVEEAYTSSPVLDVGSGLNEDAGNVAMIIGPLVKGVSKLSDIVMRQFPGLSKETAKKVAGEVLLSQADDVPMYAKNAAEAAKLQEKFPGMKFTVGQSSADPKALAAEKALVNLSDAGKDAKVMQQVQADDAIRARLQTDFPGAQGADDAIRPVQATKDALTRDVKVAETLKDRAGKALSKAQQPEDVGATLMAKAIEGKAASKATVREKFGKVDPTIELPSEPLSKTLNDIERQSFGKKPDDYPSDVMNFIKSKIIKEDQKVYSSGRYTPETKTIQGPVAFGDTIEMRSQITDALRAEKAKGPLANETVIKRLTQLLGAVEETQATGLKAVNPAAHKDYLDAKKFYKEDYVSRFKQGATADVIRKTGTGDQYVDNAMIGREYFKPGNEGVRAAQDFQKTFGTDTAAREAIRDYAAQDMLKAAKDELTGEISTNKMMGWINRHRPAITKYGLWEDFRDITKAGRQLAKAQEAEAAFSKSYAAKFLGTDPDKAIANVFSGAGKKNSAAAAQEIMGQLKGDKKAIQGMQNATKDYILDKIQSTTKDAAGNPLLRGGTMEKWMKDLDPALAVIYRDNPSKLTALKETRQALDILRRSNTNLTGSSETAMFFNEAAKRGIGALGGPWATLLLGWAKRASNEEINRILVQAYFNPEIASQLVNAVKGKTSQPIFMESMKGLVAGRVAGAAMEESTNQEKAK